MAGLADLQQRIQRRHPAAVWQQSPGAFTGLWRWVDARFERRGGEGFGGEGLGNLGETVQVGPEAVSPGFPALNPAGTPFQLQVWYQLTRIPSGQTVTYSQLAAHIGLPGGARAVAAACAANPLALLIPCHRVLAANGAPSGYRWGIERKLALLQMESRMKDQRSGQLELQMEMERRSGATSLPNPLLQT